MIKRIFVWMFKPIFTILSYNGLSLQKKVMINYVFLLLIPIVLYYIILNTYSDRIKLKELNLLNQLNKQAVDEIDDFLNDLMQLSIMPLYDNEVLERLSNLYSHGFSNETDDKIDSNLKINSNGNSALPYDPDNKIAAMASKISRFKKYTNFTFFFDRNGAMLTYGYVTGQLIEKYNIDGTDWFGRCLKLQGSPVISGSNVMVKSAPHLDSNFFSVSRAINNPASNELLGVISIVSDMRIFRDSFKKIGILDGEKVYIIDDKNNVIYDKNEGNINKEEYICYPEMKSLKNSGFKDGEIISLYIGTKKYTVMTASIKTSGWKLIRAVPDDALYSNTKKIQDRLILFVIAFTLLSLLFSIALSLGITKPIKKLSGVMKIAEKGDLSVRFKVKYNDEIGQLGNSFNIMIAEIEDLINDVYVANVRKKEAELNALQAQINPHFIYNTLESIRMMAKVNNDKDAADMLFTLGKLLRYSINTKKQVVAVKDEMEHLKNYLALQNHRFEDKFELLLNIPDDFLDIRIIKLVFQPIVENAIYHALEAIEGRGVIKITGYQENNGIYFEIQDNGVGMTEEQLDILTQRANDFTSTQENSRGVGLKNINERIKLYYGEKYGLRFFSEHGKGTTIRIELPDRMSMNNINIGYCSGISNLPGSMVAW